MSKLTVSFDNNPKYIRPLAIRIASDDYGVDKYAAIQDWADPKQLQKLFKSWVQVIREVNIYEKNLPYVTPPKESKK